MLSIIKPFTENNPVNPIKSVALIMFEPIIFPIPKTGSFFLIEIIVVTNSGKEVPKAMIVSEITLSDTPNVLAIKVALSTTKSLPKIIPANP